MKLLLDENLSFRLARRIDDLFPGSQHISDFDLKQAPDREIWRCARDGGFCLVSADADLYELVVNSGPPPKLIWLRGCNYPTSVAEQLLRTQSIRIMEFLEDDDRAILVLPAPGRSRLTL